MLSAGEPFECCTDLRIRLVRIDLEVGARLLRGEYGGKRVLAFLAPGVSLSEGAKISISLLILYIYTK